MFIMRNNQYRPLTEAEYTFRCRCIDCVLVITSASLLLYIGASAVTGQWHFLTYPGGFVFWSACLISSVVLLLRHDVGDLSRNDWLELKALCVEDAHIAQLASRWLSEGYTLRHRDKCHLVEIRRNRRHADSTHIGIASNQSIEDLVEDVKQMGSE